MQIKSTASEAPQAVTGPAVAIIDDPFIIDGKWLSPLEELILTAFT